MVVIPGRWLRLYWLPTPLLRIKQRRHL